MIQSKYFLAVVLKAISNGISDLNAFELLALCKQVLPQNAAKRRLAIFKTKMFFLLLFQYY